MGSAVDYARNGEKEEAYNLSEWIKAVRSLIEIWILKFRRSMSTKATSVCKNHEVAETPSIIHDTYGVVPADKAPNNIVLICRKHYTDCLKI